MRLVACGDDQPERDVVVAAQVLGGGMDDDVGAVLDRPAEVWRSERVVDDQRHAGTMGDVRDGGKVDDVKLRIADRLRVDRFGIGLQRPAEALRLVRIDEGGFDPEIGKGHRELRIRAAVERSCGDDVIALPGERQQRRGLRRHAGRGSERRAPAFERGDALLERTDRGVGNPRVDVAEGLQIEQARCVIDAVEDEGSRLIDR